MENSNHCPPCPDFKKSQTYRNLLTAWAGELQACGKYQVYALKAREDGFEQMANIFDETSGNEREHAELWLKWMNDGEVPDTKTNLEDSSIGEREEWKNMYPTFARTAREEGYDELAGLFLQVGSIEHHHDNRFGKLIMNMQRDEVFRDDDCTIWICLNCGHIHRGRCAPQVCPTCGYPQAYFERRCTNY